MFGFIQPTIDTIGLFLISNFFALGTFGPWGGTLSTTKDAKSLCPVWPAKVPT